MNIDITDVEVNWCQGEDDIIYFTGKTAGENQTASTRFIVRVPEGTGFGYIKRQLGPAKFTKVKLRVSKS